MQLTLKYRFRNKKTMYFKKNFALENVSLHLNMFLKILPESFWITKKVTE
jgi:hypothetical protein